MRVCMVPVGITWITSRGSTPKISYKLLTVCMCLSLINYQFQYKQRLLTLLSVKYINLVYQTWLTTVVDSVTV